MIIKAHGKTYESKEAAQDRILSLEFQNARPGVGPSDGRVTEILTIKFAIQKAEEAEKLAGSM